MSTVATIPAPATAPTTAATTTILVVEDTPFWQKQIMQAIQAAGYTVVLASNGMEALALIDAHKPALIVSDVEMPQMGGLELMKALRSRPQFQKLPIIILTTEAAKDRVVEATRLKAAEYMLKAKFSADHLVDRVRKQLAAKPVAAAPAAAQKPLASAFPRLLQRSEVVKAINAQIATGKTLAGVIPQTIELCKTPQNNAVGLLEIVKHDPIFAMRVVQQANAAKRVGTVEEAVRVVGSDGIKTIAQSLTAYAATSKSALATWQHSIAVASVMHKIVPRSFEMSIGVAYLIGLLHDLPEILFRQAFPSQYEAAADYADQAGKTLRHIMPDVFSISISDIANDLVSQLKLPPLIAAPIREYTASTAVPNQSAPITDRLAMALRFAEFYANALHMTPAPSEALIAPLSQNECRAAYIASDAINGEEIRNHAIAVARKLAGDATEPAATATARPRLWYARHNSYAALDPIEEALKRFADVETHPEPPSRREHFAGLNGVVVCAPAIDTYGLLWCLPDRMPQGPLSSEPKVLYVLPSGAATDAKRHLLEEVSTLQHPFALAAFEESLKQFRP